MQDVDKQGIASVCRDLLLLHQNGDLELIKGTTLPPNGTYVTALYGGRMIRGRVCPSQVILESQKSKQKMVSVIDVDEGKIVQLPLNQLRFLPKEMMALACQAVRCDIGMDCIEQFEWPPHISNMLLKALGNAMLFVENISTRPGSIPTISGKITLCNPSTGESISIQRFLLEIFSVHLDLCSLEKFKPFPVGMAASIVPQNLALHQQPRFGMNIQGLPANTIPVPYHSPVMPLTLTAPPNVPSNNPQNFPNFFQGPPAFMPPLSPNVMQNNIHPYVRPFSSCTSVSETSSVAYQGTPPPLQPLADRGSRPEFSDGRYEPKLSSSLSSLSSLVMSESEYDSAECTHSTVGVELHSFSSKSSSGDQNSKVKAAINNQARPSQQNKKQSVISDKVVSLNDSTSSDSLEINLKVPSSSSSSPGKEGEGRVGFVSSSSSLSADAPPFVPRSKRSAKSPISDKTCVIQRNDVKNINRLPPQPSSPSGRKSADLASKIKSATVQEEKHLIQSKEGLKDNTICPQRYPSSGRQSDDLPLSNEYATVHKKSLIQSNQVHNSTARPQPCSSPVSTPAGLPSKRSTSADIPSKSKSATTQEKASIQSKEDPKSNSIQGQQSSLTPLRKPDLPLKSDRAPTNKKVQISSDLQQPSCSSSHTFPKGPDVELPQIVRNWRTGQVVPAVIAKVWNPSCFEVNIVDEFSELLDRILEEMNEYYISNKVNMSSKVQAAQLCGHFCACFDADEGVWFRAEIDEWFMDDSVTPLRVWAVDYGGLSRVDLGSIQPLCTELASTSPRLVTLCTMRNVQPRSENNIWPQIHLDRVKQLLPEEKELYLRIDGNQSEEFIWPVSVFTDKECSLQSINEILVSEGCAYYIGSSLAKDNISRKDDQMYEEADNPMEEAYELGGNNYEIDDEDACVAVSGWKPKEEEGICWFYHRNGYCYKNYCELKHVRLNPDGITIEQREMHTCSFEDIQDLLSPGKTIKLVVTRILTVNHFMASIKFEKGSIKSRETLASVLKNLNSTEMKRSLKTFTEFPADGEIVLFKDSKTKMFYRGRIITSSPNNDDLYQVLNVDNGYIRAIPLEDLRRVDPAFLHHPFQAVECWLADVAPTQTDRDWTKSCNSVFAEMVRDTKLSATIIRSSPWGIEVNLLDKDGNDLTLMLKEMNILKSCPMRHLPLPGSHQIPG